MEKTVRTSQTVRFFAALAGAMGCIVMGLVLYFIRGSEDPMALITVFCFGFVFFVGIWVFSGRFWTKKIKVVEEENSSALKHSKNTE